MTGGEEAGLAGLFISAFTSATLLPGTSEAVLAGLSFANLAPPLLLLAVAATGNVLGSSVNWMIGRWSDRLRGTRWFPVSDASLERADRWYAKYGRWSLLGAWLPVIGDPLTLVAGVLREPFWSFLLIVALAKTARYAAVLWGLAALAR